MAEGLGGSQKVGGIYVEASLNTAPLQAGLKQAETATQQAGQKMGANLNVPVGGIAGKGGFLDGIGNGIKGATAGLRSAVGAITAVLGVASRLLGIVGLITSGVYLVSSAISAVRTGMSGSADSAEKLKQNIADAEKIAGKLQDAAQKAAQSLGMPNVNPDVLNPAMNEENRQGLNKINEELGKQVALLEKKRSSREALLKNPNVPTGMGFTGPAIDKLTDEINALAVAIRELEAKKQSLEKGRDKALEQIIQAVAKAFENVLKESMQKQLESIAIDSARSRQIAEEMQSSQFRGP